MNLGGIVGLPRGHGRTQLDHRSADDGGSDPGILCQPMDAEGEEQLYHGRDDGLVGRREVSHDIP
jgi:hypothetical protein